ncbi:MAG: hypothetical protein HY906_27685 [Deltaproteobacteria bacterium]|nr:hypothetical protein [Deltaproteobacteria bacterium]
MRTRRVLLVLGLLLAAVPARADKNDLALWKLGQLNINPDGTIGMPGVSIGADAETQFRSLASELGVVLAPRFLMPADTLGYSGFQFSAELSFTTINTSQTTSPWRNALERHGQIKADGNPDTTIPGVLTTVGVFARKGIWLPVPSFEVGAGALNILETNMFALQVYAKLAIHEGFHGWPLPSVAIRGAASRLMGSTNLDLTIASLDFSLSYSFGLGGTINLAPYAGYNLLWIIPRSQVLDANPTCDAYVTSTNTAATCPDPRNPSGATIAPGATELNSNFVFRNQDNIVRHRVFFGLKLKFHVIALIADYAFIPAGSSADANGPGGAKIKDMSKLQHQASVSLALDF